MTKRFPQLAPPNACTGCMACIGTCHVGALNTQMGNDGHIYPILNTETCVKCLRCEHVCQGTKRYIGNNDLSHSSPFGVWANDEELRSYSTSGGFATAVSKHFVENNGGVVGVAFDGKKAKHIYVDNTEKLHRLQGSKYVWSDASESYHAIESNLYERPVLFIGTGCQVAGVLSCFGKHPYRDRLYTIDLICGGVPSDLLMQTFFKTNPEIEAITSFRTKKKYELKGIVNGKEVLLPKQALPLSGFCAEQTMRYSCYNCPFAFAHRKSDITIGDLWGECSPKEQREKGVSLVVIHSKKGLQILHKIDVTTQPKTWDEILMANKRLVYGLTPITNIRRHLERNYHHMDSNKFIRIYSNSSPFRYPIGFTMRVWIHLLRKLNDIKCANFIKKIIADR